MVGLKVVPLIHGHVGVVVGGVGVGVGGGGGGVVEIGGGGGGGVILGNPL